MFSRKKSIFSPDEYRDNPDNKIVSFRRKIVLLSAVLGMFILLLPVYKDRQPSLEVQQQLKNFAVLLKELELRSTRTRKAAGFYLTENNSWNQSFSEDSDDCNLKSNQTFFQTSSHIVWKVVLVRPKGEKPQAGSVDSFCYSPLSGLLVNGSPVEKNDSVYFVAIPKQDLASGRNDRGHQLILEPLSNKLEVKPLQIM